MGQDIKSSDLTDVKFHSVLLGEGIKGFVYISTKNIPHIFIDESLSLECTAETITHEIYHLKYDKLSHGIGLDRQQDECEQKANEFAIRNAKQVKALMTI